MNGNIYNETDDDLRPEYDLSKLKGGIRGKYAQKYKEGTNLILLEPDVAEVFQDNKSVNEALRLLIKIADTKLKKSCLMSGCYRTHQSETPNQTDLTSNHQLQPISTAEHCGMYSGFQNKINR
ncbi:MAG: hypothetical protein BWK80_60605 [Desulfobacteraceae bacterium IS3]|nr:MAG: hypothetical protein BWK80_60605 [Desulfobacteraceae bacterium IS3]